jgi:hypothetical protein
VASGHVTGGPGEDWGKAKHGEGRASPVEPIFGDLIDSVKSAQQTQTAGEMPAGASGVKDPKPNYLI